MPKHVRALSIALLCCLRLSTAPRAAAGQDDAYQAIRTNDLARLKALIDSPADANAPGAFGNTALMNAAAAGSVDAMKFLIDKGADINAQNAFGTTALTMSATQIAKVRLLLDHGAKATIASKQGRTALFVAAMSEPSAAIVRLLIAKGADVHAKDASGNTILNAAAVGNDIATIRLLIDAGLDVNGAGITGLTPLISSAYHGNLTAVKLLLSTGAGVNAVAKVPRLFLFPDPKSGPIALTSVTALIAAAGGGSPELLRTLLDAGADVNARDGRGMTPLMLAVARTNQDPAAIRLLLDRRADVTARSGAGETAQDWARKVGAPAALQLLNVAPLQGAAALSDAPPSVDVKTAAERGLALLESSSQKFFESSGCVSCHHQNAAGLAAGEARAKGLRFDAKASAARIQMLKDGPPPPLLLERMDIGVPEIFASTLTALAAENVPPNPVTDMIAANIAATQAPDGSWHILAGIGNRPPTEEGGITRAALCIQSLKVYGPPARAGELNARIAKARQWLLAAKAVTAEDRNMQLLGLSWADADAGTLKNLAAAILAQQQADGAWRQHGGVPTDAYATGQSLYVLAKAGGVLPADPAYQRGVSYLLATQNANGAWRVTSRAPKFQAYFNSGFPYGGDQWISAWATGWATMALAQAVPAQPLRTASGR
jgi:ankyrin repeat protein